MKPMEVEILVAEVGHAVDDDRLFHVLYDGTVMDEQNFSVLGGEAEATAERLASTWQAGMGLNRALGVAVAALAGTERNLVAGDLEVGVLSRSNGRRCFQRLNDELVGQLLA